MMGVTFANPEYFLLLLLIPVMIIWYWKRRKHQLVEMQGCRMGRRGA